MANIQDLLKRKKVLKTQFTKFREKINIEELDAAESNLILDRCKQFREDFSVLFKAIYGIVDEDAIDPYIDEETVALDKVNEVYLQVVREQNGKIEKNQNSKTEGSLDGIKLPKLTLPVFSGNLVEWITFKDMFVASVHNNNSLSPAQKLNYLKSSLKADAYKIIQAIPISDNNYSIAWDLLAERYSNTREQVFAYIKKLANLPQVHTESASAILNLIDSVNEIIRSLEFLEQKVQDFADTLILFQILQKLDVNTKLWWERTLKTNDMPTVSELLTFLKDHARTLQNSHPSINKVVKSKTTSLHSNTKCICCAESHNLFKCPKFLNMQVSKRIELVKNKKLCYNCLGSHNLKNCKSSYACKYCGKYHNSLLHLDKFRSTNQTLSVDAKAFIPGSILQNETVDEKENSVAVCSNNCQTESSNEECNVKKSHILLCTALVKVKDSQGNYVKCRCLLDSGSERSFIKKKLVQALGLKVNQKQVNVSCLGESNTTSHGEVDIIFTPHFTNKFQVSTSAYVIEQITGPIPSVALPQELCNNFSDLVLADPTFFQSNEIDILLGVNVFLTIMLGDIIKRDPKLPFALRTKLGWIISGATSFDIQPSKNVAVHQLTTEEMIQSFWELEQIPLTPLLTKEEKQCETHFNQTHSRDDKGRYTVKLPFKEDREVLGDSRNCALKQFLSLEKRLQKTPTVYNQYKAFMQEYESLSHMTKVPQNITNIPNQHYFIPHHHVTNEQSISTKLRVVFNASAKTSSGVSLNDVLLTGPKTQADLFDILLRFRCYDVAIISDITKMYRQVLISPEDRNYQKIFWRYDQSLPIEEYKLNTVTYGLTPASYLATRVLKQLAIDEGYAFPNAAEILLNNCYMDDILFGANTSGEANIMINQLLALLQKGGFNLHKWCSNHISILNRIKALTNHNSSQHNVVDSKTIKVLGIKWQPSPDEFTFELRIPENKSKVTKRTIFSSISKLFDPLGWLAPFVISLKILMQSLWKLKLEWDEQVPTEIESIWRQSVESFDQLQFIKIPRKVLLPDSNFVQLIGFCDASEKAYAAVVYLKSTTNSSSLIQLLTSKTRVCPLKTISIPRLELCAALLLSHLLQSVRSTLNVDIQATYAFTDSTIVLSWINSEPTRWKTFIANRVSDIQNALPSHNWRHISGQENPADCASRGILLSELRSHSLWWSGPTFLQETNISCSQQLPFNDKALTEERKKIICSIATIPHLDVMEKVSSFSKLKRIIAYCLRFCHNCKAPKEKIQGFLTTTELSNSRNKICWLVQQQSFTEEYSALMKSAPLNAKSKLLSLSPFLDDNGVIRVGGRLNNSNLSHERKHPILLPKSHHLTKLIVDYFHLTHLHAGPQLLLAAIRNEYWILNSRSIIRQQVWKCLNCHRLRAKTSTQQMADLPASRVIPSNVFSKIGIDFCGPFQVTPRRGRGIKSSKSYICIFICFVTKAIHLELVSNLSTEAFLAAFKRFVARRGKPLEIFSDCGSNFIGADRELKKVVLSIKQQEDIHQYFAEESIKWNFNPPSAPHFGGLWEAAVKSTKTHLKKTIGDQVLSIEEFSTLLSQIEACLNSRPLCPLSEDPSEISVLTPGHFLIGRPLTALPEVNLTSEKLTISQRWKLVQQLVQHFWKRWSREYLPNLQCKSKWTRSSVNLQINDLVLIKEDNLSPLQWRLGRVTKLCPSADNLVRVVKLKTSTGTLTRPIHKLSVLPKQ